MNIDDYGRVILSGEEMISLLMSGNELTDDIYAPPGEEIDQYNELCRVNDKLTSLIPVALPKEISPEEEHANRQGQWFTPRKYREGDVWEILSERCATREEHARLMEEKIEYEARDLNPVLQLMMFLVDDFRHRGIVWGVGRGSSVASFALYLIGITKINPMKYGLPIGDFLKD